MKICDLKNKKIAIWGLGVEGKAVLKVLNEQFPDKKIDIIDDKNCPSNKGLNVCVLNQLKSIDIVIRSPGVSIYKEEIELVKKNFGVQFLTEKSLFFAELENEKVKVIAITGTKGKTTTSIFCAYILEKLGYKVMLMGNMGVPTIEQIENAKKCDYVVIELSSYQTSDLLSFPGIGVILNLFPEHIDWHRSHKNYYLDKINLLKNVKYKIVNGTEKKVIEYTHDMDNKIIFGTDNSLHYKDGYFFDGKIKLFSTKNMQLLGDHNYQNLCSVFTILKTLNIDLNKIKQGWLDEFKPIDHRMEIIKRHNIIFVNDSISTIPEATMACYNVFKNHGIYGILGGFNREQDYSALVNYILASKNIKFISLLGQTSQRIGKMLEQANFKDFKICASMKECVETLYEKAESDKNSVIILSPSAPSYDMYKNFEERGKDFRNVIGDLD